MSTDTKTHWKKLTDPRYIGVYALPDEGEDMTVTISFVQYEEIVMMGGKKEMHTIAYLDGQKPLILNATNSKSIAKLYTPYIENWANKEITLYASTTNFGAEKNIPCLRVRPSVMKKTRQFISDERLLTALGKIASGEYTIEKLREKFAITTEQELLINRKKEVSNV